MALLDLDFAEFKELTQARLSDRPNNTVQQLHEELQQLKRDSQVLESDLRASVEALKQENSVLCAQLAKSDPLEVKEGAENRERSFVRKVQHLTDQLSAFPTMTNRDTDSPCQCPKPLPCLYPTVSALHPSQQHPGSYTYTASHQQTALPIPAVLHSARTNIHI